MNTPKLPPLPHWCEEGSPFAQQMQAYAIAAIEALRAQIGQGEPVAWSPALDYPRYEKERVWCNGKPRQEDIDYWEKHGNGITLAYTHPAPQQKPLTDEQINQMWSYAHNDTSPMSLIHVLTRAIEAAQNIGEKK